MVCTSSLNSSPTCDFSSDGLLKRCAWLSQTSSDPFTYNEGFLGQSNEDYCK